MSVIQVLPPPPQDQNEIHPEGAGNPFQIPDNNNGVPMAVIQPIDQLMIGEEEDVEMAPPAGFPSEVVTLQDPLLVQNLRWPPGSQGTSRSRRQDFENSVDLRTVPVIRRSKHVRVDNDRYLSLIHI